MKHCIDVEVRRHYKVYVDDKKRILTPDQAAMKGLEMARSSRSVLEEFNDWNEIDPDDVLAATYFYPVI